MRTISDKLSNKESDDSSRCHVANLINSRIVMMALALCFIAICSTSNAVDYYAGQTYTFTANAIPGYIYEWTASAGNPVIQPAGADLNTFHWTAPPTGQNVKIEVLVNDPYGTGCVGYAFKDIEVKDLAALGDFVWNDLNGNGIQDPGEPGIPGVLVELLDGNGAPALDPITLLPITTYTDANGEYYFNNLIPGDYKVKFNLPAGYYFSPQNAGADDAKDSDPNTATGETGTITLAPGQSDLTVDAGMINPTALGDFVWKDLNSNGIQDAGEPGISGVTVELYDSSGTLIATTTTNANGLYSFTNLAPGDYKVKFYPLPCYFFTKMGQGTSATDSDADTKSGETAITNLISGEIDNTWDAGLIAYDPKIALDKTADKAEANVGKTITYTYTITVMTPRT